MAAFATLPFADQLARIRAVVAEGADPGALLREAADLPDAEPLALLLETLAAAGRLGPDRSGELAEVAGDMPDAALQYLFFREPMHPRVREVLAEVAERAVRTWSLERVHALVLLSRWLRQRAPEVHGRLVDAAEQHLNDAEPDGRWLLFASGERLASLAHDARWGPSVRRTVRRVLDALARAPKSISQANAEALLAKRVYADAGHFFFELLQNADDAGATRWAADIHADRIVARHDGTPFSFRDVVGLLSIGQTTKEQEQIGFFGVGFKSVYEVCDRPRVHSGPFDFEIAHVSIPRALSERPAEAGADAGDTALVLPLDPDVDVETLHARARAIPPETLLTLPHVAGMRVQGPDGTPWAWTKEPAGATVTLRRSGSDDARRYRCARRHVRFEGRREANRTDESPVLVAVALDDEGRPRPVDGATVFAFLPTSEHTGLRALVHARFDVTLDRERLERGSPWNDALLSEAGRGLADVVLQLVEDGADPLPVLPSPAEMAPGMAPLAHALREALADRACLPSADGARVAPRRARLLDPPLAHALAGLDLGGGSRALAPLDPRGQQVARFLGATPFTGADLVRFAGRALRAGTAPPPWLGEPVWRALGEAAVEDAALRALPLLVDGAGALVAAEEARVGAGPWAALYAGERPVVAEDELARLPAALRRRIAPAPFDPAQAVTDLQDPARRERLVAKEDALLRALAGLDDDDLAALAEVPLLRTGGGPRRSIAQGLRRLEGTLADLADVLASEVPLLAPDVERAHEALVARWVPRFGLSELADVLATGGLREAAGAERVHGVLDREAPRIGRPLALRFASVPLFSDRHGVRRPLRGPDRALRTRDDSLARALPDWPWLDAPDRPFLHAMDLPEVDAPAVVAALSGDPDMPPVPEGALPQVLPWLVAHAGALSARAVDDLAQAPVWLDAQGRPRALHALRPGGGSEAVVAFFEAAGTRTEAHAVSLRLASALRLAERLPASDLEAAVTDLARADLAPAVDRTVVAAVLAEAAETLPSERLAPLWARPLFEDGDGVRRSLTSWAQPDPQACHRAGPFRSVLRIGPLPLLSVQDEGLYRAFLGRAGPAEATAADLVRHAHADRTLLGHPAAFRQVLQAHGTELDAADRALVAELPVFRDATGTCRAARALCPRTPLLQFGDAFPLSGLGDALLDPEDEALARQLDLPTRSPAELLAERVLPTLVEGAPLAAQPEPFNGPRAVRALLEVAYAEGVDVLGHPLCVDLQGRLVRGPLASASEAVRKLAPRLGLAEMLADGPWADALSDAVASVVLERMSARRVTEALRACGPEEAPRQDHPVLADLDPLYGFLREAGPAIEADAPARGALGAAAVLPSQRGTLRAPRELVLDAAVPDLGLAWGLAPEVPPDVARWLAGAYELDRRQRTALVGHVLDGLDDAAAADDALRASELVRFLARALGAHSAPHEELERRARRGKVRDRLKVPLRGGGWEKPRRAWVAPQEVVERVDAFCLETPPRIALPDLDAPAAALLVACGARGELDEDTVDACLRGDGLRSGAAARIALARYVADRALAVPALKERWQLARRRWVPDDRGALHAPGELLWPDELATALFEEGSGSFPDPALATRLSDEAAGALGFRRAADLSLHEVAARQGPRPASAALLQWLEEGLQAGRLHASEVRKALRDVLRLRDDEGRTRPVHELAREGARELFGAWRGDCADVARTPRLARALGIPSHPDVAMIVAFLQEVGASLDSCSESDRRDLARHLPACLERLGEEAEAGRQVHLPRTAALAGLRGEAVVIARVDDPDVRLLEPAAVAEQLPSSVLDGLIDPLPTSGRSEGVAELLRAAGVRDLSSDAGAERAPARRGGASAFPGGSDGPIGRLRRWIGPKKEAAPAKPAAGSARVSSAGQGKDAKGPPDDDRFFRAQSQVGPQLETTEGWLESRREQPRFGFAFTPARLPPPWLYAPKLVATRFDVRGQQWRQAPLARPEADGDAGLVVMRGRLPKGDALLPVPSYGRVAEVRIDGAEGEVTRGAGGAPILRLDGPADVRLRVALGRAPDLDRAVAPAGHDALPSFVPDADLPEEVLDFLDELDDQASAGERAFAIRDFIRARYRYDPTYLEDPGVARWLARVTHGRANAHVAALHAGRDDGHLGAGVCYELNTLACELLRRARIPAAIATGWVFDGGSLSEPDHLWAVALLESPEGAPVWLPIDASVTRTGRPLRVPRRPPGRFRAPRDGRAKAPSSPRWQDDDAPARRASGGSASRRRAAKPKKRRPPRAELLRVLHHLEKTTGRALTADERNALERALDDPSAAKHLLERLRARSP